MNDNRLIIANFCDDVRLEVGYKYSMMGCYSGELIVNEIPSVLPKICAVVTAITPIGDPFKKLIFRAFLNESLLLENELPQQELEANQKQLQEHAEPENTRISLKIHLSIITLVIEANSILRIEAETEDGVIKGSRLRLRMRASEDMPISL